MVRKSPPATAKRKTVVGTERHQQRRAMTYRKLKVMGKLLRHRRTVKPTAMSF